MIGREERCGFVGQFLHLSRMVSLETTEESEKHEKVRQVDRQFRMVLRLANLARFAEKFYQLFEII
jgi:hypothetical protein